MGYAGPILALTMALAAGREMPAPALPFYDWKACPFEYCQYDRWTARIPVRVFDTWKDGRSQVGEIPQGGSVLALTGVVVTLRPGLIKMDRDLENTDLKRGETILTYADRGEGHSAVWFKGHYYPDFDITFTHWPNGQGCGGTHCAATYVDPGDKVWWVQVKLDSGQTGWVDMEQTRVGGIYTLLAPKR